MIVELVGCLDRATAYIRGLVADLSDQQMILQPPGAPNHAAWTLGHLIHSWQVIAVELGVNSWLPDEWESFFGYGSSPADVVGSTHSSRDVLTASLADASNRLRAALLATEERRLGEPLPDASSRESLRTIGEALVQVVCAHTAFHAGQLAAWRRAIGREPVGVFI
jgi:hypothetical protein